MRVRHGRSKKQILTSNRSYNFSHWQAIYLRTEDVQRSHTPSRKMQQIAGKFLHCHHKAMSIGGIDMGTTNGLMRPAEIFSKKLRTIVSRVLPYRMKI